MFAGNVARVTSDDWWTLSMNTVRSNLDQAEREVARRAKQVVIIGGGITGLSAAWYLQHEAARRQVALDYTLLEASSRWGGKALTEYVDGYGDAPFILEAGPDALLTHKPWAVTLARELDLEGRLIGGNPVNSRTFVLRHNQLTPLPAGLQLLVPTRFGPFVRSPLFSPWGKLRIALETFIPPRRSASHSHDESLAKFVRRRFGGEALETLAEPLMADVYNMVSSQQSILATFPQYPAFEARYGSVTRGVRSTARQRQRITTTQTAPSWASQPFVSFVDGAQTLVDALTSQLSGDLRLRSAVDRVEYTPDGAYRIVQADGSHLVADAVILAAPARVASALLRQVAPSAADRLSGIGYASIGNAYLAFRRGDVRRPLDGYGMVIPRSEGRRIDGMSWISSKWPGRAPTDHVLLRVFFGGPPTRDLMALDDERILAVIRAELADLLGVRAAPLFQRVYRWEDGYPQYTVGHLDRVAAIEAALPAGLYVAGSAYRGIGVPDCVRQGQESAQKVVAALAASTAAAW